MSDIGLIEHLVDQIGWSHETFGPGMRTEGVLDHMRKEMIEVADDPRDLEEWIDLVMLAMDGAWRCMEGGTLKPEIRAEKVRDALRAKLLKNKQRAWPDWRTADPNKAIEHKRKAVSLSGA